MIPAGNPSMTLARRANHRAAAQLAGLAGWPGVVRGKAGQPAVDTVNDLFLTAGAHSW